MSYTHFTLEQETAALDLGETLLHSPTVTAHGLDPLWAEFFDEEAIDQIKPINAKVLRTSSDEAVAVVDESGLVTAVAEGNATITGTTIQKAGGALGPKPVACEITVACGHTNAVHVDAKTPSCQTAGWSAYRFCETCGQYSLTGDFTDGVDYETDIAIAKVEHQPAEGWSFEGTSHYHECTYGCSTKFDEAVHTPHVTAATCQTNQICKVCKLELAPIADHAHDHYVKDDEHHWSVCSCGAMVTGLAEPHAFDGAGTCVCGETAVVEDTWITAANVVMT